MRRAWTMRPWFGNLAKQIYSKQMWTRTRDISWVPQGCGTVDGFGEFWRLCARVIFQWKILGTNCPFFEMRRKRKRMQNMLKNGVRNGGRVAAIKTFEKNVGHGLRL